MVILKSLKKQLNQFVTPEFETLVEDTAAMVQAHTAPKSKSDLPAENAYSHGLEDIYALENIDPKTIRKLGGQEEDQKKPLAKEDDTKKQYALPSIQEMELNLGPKYVSFMPSFMLNLPLGVLKIDESTKKAASQRGLKYIKDLVECDWKEIVLVKGLGQAHAEELQAKLEILVNGKELFLCQTIDFKSLLRSLVSEEMLTKHYINFQQYGLEGILELTPVMHLEIKRASHEVKMRWLEESLSALHTPDSHELVRSSLEQVMMTYVTPWLHTRNGFAFIYEVMDLLEQLSEDPHIFDKIIECLTSTYCHGHSIVEWIMPTNEDGVVFADQNMKRRFLQVEERALSYFYKSNLSYSLDELVLWVYREFAAEWSDMSDESIRKVILHSSSFSVHKNDKNKLIVTLY